jgi:site-specific DNA-methyltransferase (adenine-specific)
MHLGQCGSDFRRNSAQRGDALVLLRYLPDRCTPLVFFDPQHRDVLDRLAYGNEGARQGERVRLPQMTGEYIDTCCREIARVLKPSGYLMMWLDASQLCQGRYLPLADTLPVVDLVAWNGEHFGMGYRTRRCGDYLQILQKPPVLAKATWCDHAIRDRWTEKVDRKLHPHIKPIGLIRKVIGAVTRPGDLVVDPAAGSFAVMHAAIQLGREFVGCDVAYDSNQPHLRSEMNEHLSRHPRSVSGARQLWP